LKGTIYKESRCLPFVEEEEEDDAKELTGMDISSNGSCEDAR
jgi:hypothetical protein